MIRLLFIAMSLVAFSLDAKAQFDAAQAWIGMPDSIAGYLTKDKRSTMVEFYNIDGVGEVANPFSAVSAMDTLATGFASVTMSKAMRMDLMLLPTADNDTVICLVRTFYGPEPESVVGFYDRDWTQLPTSRFLDLPGLNQLLVKPDDMTQQDFDLLCLYFDPAMTTVKACPQDLSLTVSLAMPLLSKEDKTKIKGILMQRKLNWDKISYK